MVLEQVKLRNFRGYKETQMLDIEKEITAIVGKNDAGKSTILEALEIFFDEKLPSIDDLNVDAAEDGYIEIRCVFSELPDSISVDSTADTTLEQEYLLNKDGKLEIVKKYKCGKTVSKEYETFIQAEHPTAPGCEDLLTQKIDDLKKRAKELGAKSTDDRVSHLIRSAIRDKVGDLKVETKLLEVKNFDEKFQKVFKSLEKEFPLFFIFKVDRETTDADSEAKDPIQVAVKEAKKKFDSKIVNLEEEIKKEVQDVTERALEKLKEIDPNLAEQLIPDFRKRPTWTFDFKISDHKGVPINKRGSGTRRLVLLNFFRAEAENKSGSDDANIIYAIEEPETSQHPNNQKLIIDSLKQLASDDKRQVLITTHSAELIKELPYQSARFVKSSSTGPEVVNGEDGLNEAAESLGLVSNQSLSGAAGVIVVEGEADEVFLSHAANTLKANGDITESFKDKNILILPAGGCGNLPFWVHKNRLESLGLPHAIFLDSDREAAADPQTKNEAFCASCVTSGLVALTTKKREIENYLDQTLVGTTYSEYDDAKVAIASTHGIKPNKVCHTFWPQMTAQQIVINSNYTDGTDTKCEIIEIIESLLDIVD